MPQGSGLHRDERLHSTGSSKTGDKRSPAQRDRDRLVYSSAFRRLAEVTQVVAAASGYVFHNRLTHSLQVAQVGRRLAEKLLRDLPEDVSSLDVPSIDPDVVEAAGLAHDLGHPPFGHVIEYELNDLSKDFGGYEGNAQSFRILTRLAFHRYEYDGLNLTAATLAAVLKYPWFRNENPEKPKKFGAYESERADFNFAREDYPYGFDQTPEAALMDWADDITYSVHDLEDFFRAGRIPVHLLGTSGSAEREYLRQNILDRHTAKDGNDYIVTHINDLMDAVKDLLIATFGPTQSYRGTKSERSSLRSFTSSLIHRYVNAVRWEPQGNRLLPTIPRAIRDEVLMLKELTWTYVIQDPGLATQQIGQRNMIRTLYNVYRIEAASQKGRRIFPAFYQERLDEAVDESERLRICIDLIAGMTESQVQRMYTRITGGSAESSLSDPLR